MIKTGLYLICYVCIFMINTNMVYANDDLLKEHKSIKNDLSIGGVWYLSFQNDGSEGGGSKFLVKRGYINIKKKFNSWFSGRITPDSHQDDAGDLKVRLKYCYGKFYFPDLSFLTKPALEVGLVHMPWLDFEEHINYYRLQDKMFIERNHRFNSADFGLTFFALLGGEMDMNYKKKVSKKYPGKFGSIAFGVYNGGGYHAIETNKNKVFEARITIRPLPSFVPGLQLSYFGTFGKGNIKTEPDWFTHLGYLSFEHEYAVFAFTYYLGTGDQKGKYIDEDGVAFNNSGYSAFGELKVPSSDFSIVGRYDYFNEDDCEGDHGDTRLIGGIAYHLAGHHKILFDYDYLTPADSSKKDEQRIQLTLEVHF